MKIIDLIFLAWQSVLGRSTNDFATKTANGLWDGDLGNSNLGERLASGTPGKDLQDVIYQSCCIRYKGSVYPWANALARSALLRLIIFVP
jgi:hypothetical protein